MTKIGVMSDIHGNKPALQAAWHELEQAGVDETAVCGDIIGVLGWPEWVAHFVKDNVDHVVYGNHDAYLREDYSYVPEWESQKQEHRLVTGKLTEATVQWLNDLPEQVSIDGSVEMAHAKPWGDNPCGFPYHEYVDMGDWIEWASNEEQFTDQLVLMGHTHDQGKLQLSKFEGQDGKIVNPGSVGAPYYEDAKYAIIDTETHDASLHRVYYETGPIEERFEQLGLEKSPDTNWMAGYRGY